MKPKVVTVLLAFVAVSSGKRPPWYKPCWIYMCGLDNTDPICAWDTHHGARLFRNDCEMHRHNFCYNRNYVIVDGSNDVEEDINLCTRLKKITDNVENKETVVEDGNIRVHFLEDKRASEKANVQPETKTGKFHFLEDPQSSVEDLGVNDPSILNKYSYKSQSPLFKRMHRARDGSGHRIFNSRYWEKSISESCSDES